VKCTSQCSYEHRQRGLLRRSATCWSLPNSACTSEPSIRCCALLLQPATWAVAPLLRNSNGGKPLLLRKPMHAFSSPILHTIATAYWLPDRQCPQDVAFVEPSALQFQAMQGTWPTLRGCQTLEGSRSVLPCIQVISDAHFSPLTSFVHAHMPWLEGTLFSGLYSDVSPNWYRYVGDKLFLTLNIQIAVILTKSAVILAADRFARWRAKHARTQPDMNACGSSTSQPDVADAASMSHMHCSSHGPL
jgi:hypothetical protein